jgi:hypothetical protein
VKKPYLLISEGRMKKIFFFLAVLQFSLYAQLNFNPIYNLSNTPSATSDYHSTYSWLNDFYVAWGDNGAVKLRHSSDQGLTWSSNRTLNGSGAYPVIAGEGNTLIVFYHILGAGVFYQRSTDTGINWSSPSQISLHSSAITPQIENSGSVFYAVWEERPGTNYELYFSRSTDLGQSWSSPINISNTPTTSRWVQIKSRYNNVYCTWVETTSYPFSDIYFMKSTNQGITWSTPQNITNDNRPQNRIYMDLGYGQNNQDHIYLACDDISSYPVYNFDDIFLIKSTDNGTSWSTAVNITNNAGHSNTPCLVVIDESLVFFTWSDNTDSAPLYDNSDIYFKLSLDGGSSWQDSVKLCSNPESSSRPRICWGLDGPLSAPWFDLSVIWYDYSTGDAEILARNGTFLTVPVELVSFNAEVVNQSVQLKWKTASEINNKGFEIERKTSGSADYNMISFVPGKGTTSEVNDYFYNDFNLTAETYIYRLKQIDYDGTVSYSDEVEAVIGNSEFYLSQNYPNPFNPQTLIKYSISEFSRVELKIYDIIGNEVTVLVDEEKTPGYYQVEFNGEGFSSGVYFYKLQAGENLMVRKLILMR